MDINQITLNHITFMKLNFTNIRGFCSNFVESESFTESISPDIQAMSNKPG